jgi:hypothetical protein
MWRSRPEAPTITTEALSSGTVGEFYCCGNLFASGGVQPYTWSVVAGTLPPGRFRIGCRPKDLDSRELLRVRPKPLSHDRSRLRHSRSEEPAIEPAIDRERHPGDVAGRVARQEHDRAGELLRCPVPAQRHGQRHPPERVVH